MVKRQRIGGVSAACWLLAWAATAPLLVSQGITAPRLHVRPGLPGRLVLEATASPQEYYVLYASESVLEPWQAICLALPGAELVTFPVAATSGERFFRLEAVSRCAPRDTDGDGLDDLYELQHPGRLDPLNPGDVSDAAGADGRAKLREYEAWKRFRANPGEWRRLVAALLGIEQDTFLLAQGSLGLQTSDSSGLFRLLDTVPGAAERGYFDAGATRRFSDNYGLMLNALVPESTPDLAVVLGDFYAAWVGYRNQYFAAHPDSQLPQREVFAMFANASLDPDLMQDGLRVFDQSAATEWNRAATAFASLAFQENFIDPSGQTNTLRTYTPKISDVLRALTVPRAVDFRIGFGPEAQIAVTCSSEDSISAAAEAAARSAQQPMGPEPPLGAGTVTIYGTVGRYAVLAATPGQWFSAGEYARAYGGKDDGTVWDSASNVGNWSDFFSQPDGDLASRVSQILVVSDYSVTIESTDDCWNVTWAAVPEAAAAGLASPEPPARRLAGNGAVKAVYQLPAGNVEVWGVNVARAPH